MKAFLVVCTSMAFVLSMTRLVLVLSEDHKDQTVRVPYKLHFHHSSAKVAEVHRRHLGQLGQLRQLDAVVLSFDYENDHILCSMDKQSTIYTDLALERMNEEHPPATYESEDCVLTFLNETSFDGITLLHGTALHFHRADHKGLALDTSPGGETCIAREEERNEARRQLRGKAAHVSALPRMLSEKPKPALWSDCYPGVSSGYKLFIGIAVGSMFQSTFGKSATAQVQSMVSAANFIYMNQLNIELAVDHLYTGSGPYNQGCVTGIRSQMTAFTAWQKPSSQGLWHLIDDCLALSRQSISGTAYMSAVCMSPKNTGVTYCNGRGCGRGFKTFAHEIGHNFNARHSFEEGRKATGGIMDYGNGKLDGIYQFNTKYRKDEICKKLRRVIPTCGAFHPKNGNGGGRGRGAKETAYPTPFPTQTSAPMPYPTQFPTNMPTQYPTKFPQPSPNTGKPDAGKFRTSTYDTYKSDAGKLDTGKPD